MLRHRHGPKTGCEERLDIGQRTFHADHFAIVDYGIIGEIAVKGIEVLVVHGIAISHHQVLNLEPVRHFFDRKHGSLPSVRLCHMNVRVIAGLFLPIGRLQTAAWN